MFSGRVAREQIHVRVHHDSHEFLKSYLWFPVENFFRLRSVTQKNVHLGWPLISRVMLYELLPIEIGVGECRFDKLAYRVAFTSSQDEIVSFSQLQNSPDALDIFGRISPVTLCVEVAEKQFLLQALLNRCDCARNLASDESLAAPRAFMIKHDAVARTEAVTFAVVNGGPV